MQSNRFGSVALLVLAGCGGAAAEARRNAQDFECKDRLVSYIAAHHMAGDELGVQMDCAEAGPRIKRWRTEKNGQRQEDTHAMTPGEFDKTWREIDGTGWRYLKDCANGTGGKQDPVYVFDIHDDVDKATFQCQSQSMPYPYNDIVDPLDVASQHGRKQLGNDEPVELQDQDKGPKKK